MAHRDSALSTITFTSESLNIHLLRRCKNKYNKQPVNCSDCPCSTEVRSVNLAPTETSTVRRYGNWNYLNCLRAVCLHVSIK
jgi:hypothetical protein